MTYEIYFIHAPECHAIKIGLSNNVKRILREVELNSPCPIILLGSFPGNKQTLLEYQNKYQRKHGDWFEAHSELIALDQTILPASSASKVYKDISYLCYKYSITKKRLNKIITWIENSKKINLNHSHHSSYQPAGHDEGWLNFQFTPETITMIEIGIVNYSKKHPKVKITLDKKFQMVEGWEEIV